VAGLVGQFASGTARRHGASFGRAPIYSLVMVVIALAVTIGTDLVAGH
jgi:hypothetical protein